jgi:hypothetical protein
VCTEPLPSKEKEMHRQTHRLSSYTIRTAQKTTLPPIPRCRGNVCTEQLPSKERETDVEVEVTLRPTVTRPVRVSVRHLSGTCDQFFFLLEIFFRQLRVCYFVAPSLTRGRVFNLLLLLVLACAVPLWSDSCGT